jgi:hypothetical protein
MAVFKQQAAKKVPNLKIGVIHWLRENLLYLCCFSNLAIQTKISANISTHCGRQ